ncbi:MAG: hypothetical protein AAGI38_00635 [Bacteroidota bacterium]
MGCIQVSRKVCQGDVVDMHEASLPVIEQTRCWSGKYPGKCCNFEPMIFQWISGHATKILAGMLVILVGYYLVSMHHRAVNGDEAIIAEHAYWLEQVGYVKSQVYDGYGFGWEDRQYHYHKFFVLMGAGIIALFGLGVLQLKVLGLLFHLGFVWVLWRYCQREKNLGQHTFLLMLVLLLSNYMWVEYSYMYRPEIVVLALGFGSFNLLSRFLHEHKTWLVIPAGLLAGLCAFTHLNGLIFCFAGFMLLAIYKKWPALIRFTLAGAVTTLMYFYDLLTPENLEGFYYQFFNDPNLVDKQASPIMKFFEEHMRFFHSPKEISFSVLFFTALAMGWSYLKAEHRPLLIYLGFLIFGLAAIAHGTTTKYSLLYYPYMALVTVLVIQQLGKPWQKWVFLGLAPLYLGIQGYYLEHLLRRGVNLESRTEEMASFLPDERTTVLAHETFVFNQIEHHTIHGPIGYRHFTEKFHPEDTTTLRGLFEFARLHENEYLILNRHFQFTGEYREVEWDLLQVGDRLYGFEVIGKGKGYLIWQSTNAENSL